MSHIACPCGVSLWDGCDGDELVYQFVPYASIREIGEMPFFETPFKPNLSTEMWKCDVCDRMMVFDDNGIEVTRYLKRIDATTYEPLGNEEFYEGIIYNNLFFNEVDQVTLRWQRNSPEATMGPHYGLIEPLDPGEEPLTYEVLRREILSRKHGRVSNWWYARMGQDHLVFYSPYDPDMSGQPVKVWERYDQDWNRAASDGAGMALRGHQ